MNKEHPKESKTPVGHLQRSVERLQVELGAQGSLEGVQDEGDSDVSVGGLGAAQLLGDSLNLRREVLIRAH